MRILAILPTYNERYNVGELISSLFAHHADMQICVVDDSSPDGTSEFVSSSISSGVWGQGVHLVTRKIKDGRGGAVRTGLKWGLGRFDVFVEMDCDFSHHPSDIAEGLRQVALGNDVVLGSRYPNGVIVGWPKRRRIFSFLANFLARTLINWGIHDYTNGYRFYSVAAVNCLLSHSQKYTGYVYLSESLVLLLKNGFKVTEFPITFRNRTLGDSKTTVMEILKTLSGILKIAFRYRFIL